MTMITIAIWVRNATSRVDLTRDASALAIGSPPQRPRCNGSGVRKGPHP